MNFFSFKTVCTSSACRLKHIAYHYSVTINPLNRFHMRSDNSICYLETVLMFIVVGSAYLESQLD